MTDWSQIVAEHGTLVWRTARRLLAHEADSADCFQRTFLAAVELAQRETVRHWPALLRRLATARALEQLRERMQRRARFAADVDVDRQIDQEAIGPYTAAAASELAGDLRFALSEIDPRQAEVFCLACLDECSYAEVGEQLRTTANNVGVILNRAKAALRERLKSHSPASDLRETKREVGQ
jgi:RNA polymerase sigma-70 factor (ECF subfamily)